ncbi:MAG: hypothetical protein AAB440_03755 [Patescibacteria group bacterium]
MRPEHFDVLGILSFTYILAFALWAYLTEVSVPDWTLALLAFIGLVGLLIDGAIVFTYVLGNGKKK